mgnify:CR=1 FL=1
MSVQLGKAKKQIPEYIPWKKSFNKMMDTAQPLITRFDVNTAEPKQKWKECNYCKGTGWVESEKCIKCFGTGLKNRKPVQPKEDTKEELRTQIAKMIFEYPFQEKGRRNYIDCFELTDRILALVNE